LFICVPIRKPAKINTGQTQKVSEKYRSTVFQEDPVISPGVGILWDNR
jgi:hypothetical protein